ncbi:MAG: hypothetical protein WBQ55_03030, partial [Xanthobacteraceae bacterium]
QPKKDWHVGLRFLLIWLDRNSTSRCQSNSSILLTGARRTVIGEGFMQSRKANGSRRLILPAGLIGVIHFGAFGLVRFR